jgi:hypothetical protein
MAHFWEQWQLTPNPYIWTMIDTSVKHNKDSPKIHCSSLVLKFTALIVCSAVSFRSDLHLSSVCRPASSDAISKKGIISLIRITLGDQCLRPNTCA